MESSIDNRVKVLDGKKIERLRMARGFSVAELAKKAKLSQKTMGNARNGKPVLLGTIKLLADALGVTYGELLLESEASDAMLSRRVRIKIAVEGDIRELENSPYLKDFLNLLTKMLATEDIQNTNVEGGSIILTLVMSEEASKRLAEIFPNFREHARDAVRELPDGLAYFNGTLVGDEKYEDFRKLLKLIDGVTELRIEASPDDEGDAEVSIMPSPAPKAEPSIEVALNESQHMKKLNDLRIKICRGLVDYISHEEKYLQVDGLSSSNAELNFWENLKSDLLELNKLDPKLSPSFGDDESAI